MKKLIIIIVMLSVLLLSACLNNKETFDVVQDEQMEKQRKVYIELEEILEKGLYEESLTQLNIYMKEELFNNESKILLNQYVKELLETSDMKFIYTNKAELLELTFDTEIARNTVYDYFDKAPSIIINEMEQLLLNKNYEEVQRVYSNSFIKDNEEAKAINAYSKYLHKGKINYETIFELASQVNPRYKGKFSQEIKSSVMTKDYLDEFYFEEVVWDNAIMYAKFEGDSTIPPYDLIKVHESKVSYTPNRLLEPKIGMTDYEVLETSWGKPNKINKTETAYGVKEQWVYDRGYLYFEEHYLTSIQSSR